MIVISSIFCANKLWYKKPASDWETQALPIGNGYMGGMHFGGIKVDKMQYNEKTLWAGGPRCDDKYTYGNRKDAWQTVLKIQDLQVRHEQVPNNLFDQVTGNNLCYGSYHNFGEQIVEYEFDSVDNYRRELNLDQAVHTVTYEKEGFKYVRESFASYPDHVIVTRLTTTNPAGLSAKVRNVGVHGGNGESDEVSTVFGNVITLRGRLTKGHTFGGDGNVGNNMQYESQLKVIVDSKGKMISDSSSILVTGAQSVILMLVAGTDYENKFPDYFGPDPHEKVTNFLEKASSKSYDDLRAAHAKDFETIFSRVKLVLGKEYDESIPTDQLLKEYKQTPSNNLEMLFFMYGRYLLIGSSRTGSLPANLQGVWCGSNAPNWQADYHFNINLQMAYWPVDVTNMHECMDPLTKYVEAQRIPGRITAKEHFGLDGTYGWTVNTMNNPMGVTAVGWAFDWGWSPSANAWIGQNLYESFLFNWDLELLKNEIYPIIRESAFFWNHFLVKFNDTVTNKTYYVASPSYSPEHGPRTVATTYEQQLVRQHFKDVIEAINILELKEDYEFRDELQTKLDMLYPTKIGKHGQIQEWMEDIDDPNDQHRHISQLVGLFPGKEINKDVPDLFAAAKVTLTQRGDGATGWSMANKIMLWARVLDGEHAHVLVQNLLKEHVNDNLFDEHPPFQIDGNLGAPGAMAEILVQSHMGYISMIPSLPINWDKGSVTGLKTRGNFTVNMQWENYWLTGASIESGAGRPCVIEQFKAKEIVITTSSGAQVDVQVLADDKIKFNTVKGETYNLSNIPKKD